MASRAFANYCSHQRVACCCFKDLIDPLRCKSMHANKLFVVPSNSSSSPRSMSSTPDLSKVLHRVNERRSGALQDVRISNRLRLVRPGDNHGWPYSINPERVLVIFLPWLNSKEKHVNKYIQLYLDLGLDVLCLNSKAQDFLWPPTSFTVANELSEVLKHCKFYDQYLFHSLSIGSYNLTTFRILAKDVQEVSELNKKVSGIIYDSIVIGAGRGGALSKSENDDDDNAKAMDRFVRGMAGSVSQNKVVLSLASLVSKFYFYLTKKQTLDFYERAYGVVRDEPAKVPTLLLASKNDPMCDKDVVEQIVKIWKNHNVPVTLQMWDKSGHAQHLAFHRKEYIDLQRKFLDQIFGDKRSDDVSKMNIHQKSKL